MHPVLEMYPAEHRSRGGSAAVHASDVPELSKLVHSEARPLVEST